MSKIQGLFKVFLKRTFQGLLKADFSRSSKSLSNSFHGLNVNENTDLSVKHLL